MIQCVVGHHFTNKGTFSTFSPPSSHVHTCPTTVACEKLIFGSARGVPLDRRLDQSVRRLVGMDQKDSCVGDGASKRGVLTLELRTWCRRELGRHGIILHLRCRNFDVSLFNSLVYIC